MAKTLSEIVGSQNIDDTSSPKVLDSVDGAAPKLVLFPGTVEEACEILTLSWPREESVIPWGNGLQFSGAEAIAWLVTPAATTSMRWTGAFFGQG